jgi:hypothetical protein
VLDQAPALGGRDEQTASNLQRSALRRSTINHGDALQPSSTRSSELRSHGIGNSERLLKEPVSSVNPPHHLGLGVTIAQGLNVEASDFEFCESRNNSLGNITNIHEVNYPTWRLRSLWRQVVDGYVFGTRELTVITGGKCLYSSFGQRSLPARSQRRCVLISISTK